MRALLWLLAFVAALALFLALGAGMSVRNDYVQNVWLPARLVLDGANPYYPRDVQVAAALGDYRSAFAIFNSGEQFHAIYPLWVFLFFAPFGALPLLAGAGVWRAANLLLLVWGVGALVRASNPAFRAPRPAALAAIGLAVLFALVNRETLITLIVGQFAIVEFGLLVAVWGWLISSEREGGRRRAAGDALAGLALAALATKPQSLGLAVALVGLWALSRRRWTLAGSFAGSLAALLLAPLLVYPWSLGDWLSVVTGGQAGSQVQYSASVWGASYQLMGESSPWVLVASVLSVAGLLLLAPFWWRDLRDRTSPVPVSLPLTLCVNSVISPYLLGYEHVLLFLPALVILAGVGLPGEGDSSEVERSRKWWRFAVYFWLAVMPYLVLALQSSVATEFKEYPAIIYSATMLALVLISKLEWKRSTPV